MDWEDIPLGPGQQPNANGDSHSFQFTKEGDAIAHTDVRRNPDQTFRYIGHWPERP